MTPDRDIQARIAAGERWLAGVDTDLPAMDADALKRQVRVAALERWLATQDDVAVPADLAARTKMRTRAECDRKRRVAARWVAYRHVRRWSAAAASLAACVTLVFVGMQTSRSVGTGVMGDGSVRTLDRWVASLHGPMPEVDASLVLLEREVRAMELSIGAPESAPESVDAALMEDLLDDSERLLADLQDEMG